MAFIFRMMPPTENYRVPCRERQAREGFLEYRDSPQETKQENIFANNCLLLFLLSLFVIVFTVTVVCYYY